MIVLLISNLMKFVVPIGFFIWSLFHPNIASYVFIGLAAVFAVFLFLMDIIARPKPDTCIWDPGEIEVMRKYHLAIKFPYGAKNLSCYLNGIRWSSLIWVPWLLWNHLWIPSGFLVIYFFLTASLSVRLDPFFFLSDAVDRGQWQFAGELTTLETIREKFNQRIGYRST